MGITQGFTNSELDRGTMKLSQKAVCLQHTIKEDLPETNCDYKGTIILSSQLFPEISTIYFENLESNTIHPGSTEELYYY